MGNHFLIIQPHLLEKGSLQVADVMRTVHRFIANVIGAAFDDRWLRKAASGEGNG